MSLGRRGLISLADSVCCFNVLCRRILIRDDANNSTKYPQ